MTSGVAALGPAFWLKVADKLASLIPAAFDPGNDPWGERDFMVFEVAGYKLYGEIAFRERQRAHGRQKHQKIPRPPIACSP